MNQQSLIGWGLALAALVSGYLAYGWPGVALALSVVVFWLMLQFSRALRAMRKASQSPLRIASRISPYRSSTRARNSAGVSGSAGTAGDGSPAAAAMV